MSPCELAFPAVGLVEIRLFQHHTDSWKYTAVLRSSTRDNEGTGQELLSVTSPTPRAALLELKEKILDIVGCCDEALAFIEKLDIPK